MSQQERARYLEREAEKAGGGPILKLCYACGQPIIDVVIVDTTWDPPRWYCVECGEREGENVGLGIPDEER